MPQKRNPDVLELVRSSTAVAQAALLEILAVTAKLSSGYQRDLQRLKAPLFRAIDLGIHSSEIMAHTVSGIEFRPDQIELAPDLFAAEQANRIAVDEDIPFREAYQRIARQLAKKDDTP